VATKYGDLIFAEKCQKEAAMLQKNIEKNSWDGEWYLRAWFDNGTPLGSSTNTECQIDSIAQSWSVLSGAGERNRTKKAMESVDKRLIRRNPPLIQLLDPPFDKSDLNPGYIKGYVPGVRENGGQYTHAAIWAAMAFAKSGDVEHAWELLSIINPLNHGSSREDIEIYKAEPYVVAADVYAVSPHTGRGGWTWYTGSAGLLYRLIIESLLGLRREVNKLYIEPCIPADWSTYDVYYRYNETMYNITVILSYEADSPVGITIDGSLLHERFLTLVNDMKEHLIIWRLLQAKLPDTKNHYSELEINTEI
jgi:cyclic beta-1,2-glucan synthetase